MKATYQIYRQTSIQWLPKVPDNWKLIKTKRLFKERSEKGFENEPLLAATQTQGVVLKEMYETRTVTAQKDFDLLKLVKVGDFVISLRSFQGGIEYAYYQGIISPAYSIFYQQDSKQVNKEYFKYFFKSEPFISSLTLFVTGIREGQNINFPEFKDSLLPLPPFSEQTAIAQFLDKKTELINAAIFKKQRLIELLKEQKQAAINELLQSKKDKWPTKKIKYLAKLNPTRGGSTINIDESDEVVFLPMEKVSEKGEIDCSIKKSFSELKNGFTYFERGDIIIAKITPCFENGKGALLENLTTVIGFGSTEFHTLRPNHKKVLPHYLKWVVFSQAFRSLGEYFMIGSAGQKRVPTNFISNYKVSLPPLSEQEKILIKIQEQSNKIETAITRIEREIELIKEYKQSLIAEAVTGKIKIA